MQLAGDANFYELYEVLAASKGDAIRRSFELLRAGGAKLSIESKYILKRGIDSIGIWHLAFAISIAFAFEFALEPSRNEPTLSGAAAR